MENPTDIELIDKIKKENCNNSLIQLSERHSALCHSIYRLLAPKVTASGLCISEISKEKDLVVWKSAISYNPQFESKFSTWLGSNIRWQCLNTIKSDGRYILMDEVDLQSRIDESDICTQPPKDLGSTFEYIFSILEQLKDKRIRQVFELRYSDKKLAWSKIAKTVGVSTQTAINLHERGKKILAQKLKSESCFDKI
jgi:RNA polymerase sigma factor (sigma-70 family)